MEREDKFKSSALLHFGESFEVKAKAYTEGLRTLSTASSFKQKVDFREHRPLPTEWKTSALLEPSPQKRAPTAAKKWKLHEEVRQMEEHYINNINSRIIIHNKVIFSKEKKFNQNSLTGNGAIPLTK